MNVSNVITMDYENILNWAKRTQSKPILTKKCQNKPNTNPIYPAVASGEAGTKPIYNELVEPISEGKCFCCA
jgi:hypothetical protein